MTLAARSMLEQFLESLQEGDGLIVIRSYPDGEWRMAQNVGDRVEVAKVLNAMLQKVRASDADVKGAFRPQ